MDIIALNINGADQKVCDCLSPLVSLERRQIISSYRFLEDRLRSLFSELLIQTYAKDKWKMEDKDIVFKRTKYGKPFFSTFPNLQFNVSHSGHWVVGAFGEWPVGIDIEEVSPIDTNIAESFFSIIEQEQLQKQTENQKTLFFYRLWTLKESYIKADGRGLSIPLDSFAFKINEEKIVFESNTLTEPWHFRRYTIGNGYECAVCAPTSSFPEQAAILSWNELVSRYHLINGSSF
ncbi:4'-phosphopantetheinyl transferase family protein [Fictibacillus fluitans]|uniref:4'-phosphopantetheinyl transferase superfamily protein n=1 Tax=Fictibacillus fluitans TaxID=3058422 RepID=A0ABT8HTK3_9BACL|nr:4'-phosphopantetheinyl transferase superfamily protein [Fictibacillus sp. NE201]MDN4524098.1 4'-phosphopantetheinyl transferase superfamily protein [Fictibacillus sp. NE201]